MKKTFYSLFFILLILKPFFAETKTIATMYRTKLTYQDMTEIFNDELQKPNFYSNYLWNYKVYTEENNQNNSWSVQTRNDGYKGSDGTYIKEFSLILNMDNGFIEVRTYGSPTTYSGQNTVNDNWDSCTNKENNNWAAFLEESCKWKKRWQCTENWTMEQFDAIDKLLIFQQNGSLWNLIITHKNIETIKQYVSVGADVNKNMAGITPLSETARLGLNEIVKLLIEKGADVNFKNTVYGNSSSILYYRLNTETAKILIHNGANITTKNDYGETPLHNHCKYWFGTTDIISLLLQHGAIVNEKDNNGETPIFNTIIPINDYWFNKSIQDYESSDNVNFRNRCKENSKSFIQLLISYGADVNIQNNNGRTVLMNACEFNENSGIIPILLLGGADISLKDKEGQTALDIALKNNCTDIIPLLQIAQNNMRKTNE